MSGVWGFLGFFGKRISATFWRMTSSLLCTELMAMTNEELCPILAEE